LPIVANPAKEQEEVIAEDEQRGANLGSEVVVKLKVLSHFIKGIFFKTPMETILVILGELEYLEGLVKLTKRRKNAKGQIKGELGQCSMGEHTINTQGLPSCHMTLGRLSFWEEAEVIRQIQALVDLGKIHNSASEYDCIITLPMNKEGSRRFCGDYHPLSHQTR
jgi:hypothetical protein